MKKGNSNKREKKGTTNKKKKKVWKKVLLIMLFIILVYRCVRIALKCEDIFACMLVIGIGSLIGIQAALNIAVATSSMPATGVALPFVSYGGTSLTMLMGEIGIVLNISKHVKIN